MKTLKMNTPLSTPSNDSPEALPLRAAEEPKKDVPDDGRKTFDNSNSEIVHGSYWPMDIRRDTGVSATIIFHNNGETNKYETSIWRISPLGAEFAQEAHLPKFSVGDVLEINVIFKNQACAFHGIVVSTEIQAAGRNLIGLRWCENDREQIPQQTRRSAKRWICSTSFLPTAVAPNPILFNDMLLFRVVDVSKSGARVLTSMRNKFIIPNMFFDGVFTFPMIGSGHGRFRVKWTDLVSNNGKQELSIGVEFDNPSKELTKLMGEYILQFGDQATVKEIRDSGLNVRSTGRAVDISYVRTEQDYRDVLELRRACYEVYATNGGEIPELSDIFDSRARIIIVRHRGKCVASTRIIYHDIGDTLEQEQYGKMPEDMPRNDELVEVTRICTHPDYRASDLVYEMAKYVYVAMIQAKRRYLIGSSPENLMPMYLKMGGKKLGITYSPKSCPELKLEVLVFDLLNFLKGVNVNPIVWSLLGEDLLKLAVEQKFVYLDTMTKIRLSVYKSIKPLTGRLLRAVETKKKK